MGALLAAQPSNLQLLGAGRRAATLRSRVRAVKRFLDWLAVSHVKGYPTELHDFTGYLQARQSEPCTRGALKGAHKALVFMEEVAGVTAQARITTSSLYLVIQMELLANSIPGRPTRQAPRMFMSMLAALEELTVNDKALPYYRVYAWWILLQSWGTMRFSDHRGLIPTDVLVTGNSMTAKLTRSKTTGDDKDVAFRMVRVASCCFLVSPLLAQYRLVPAEKSGRLPKGFSTPSASFKLHRMSAQRAALRHWLRDAEQGFVFPQVQRPAVTRTSASFWSPHSARSFLPSATAALGVPKDQRDYLGGWAARMITNLQKLVMRASQGTAEDPFAEAETSKQFDDYLCSKGYSPEDRALCFKGLERQNPQRPPQQPEELILEESEPPREAAVESEPERQEELHVDPNAKRDKRLKSENAKSESLGLNPKEARERARAQLQNGYYISTSGRNSTRVLHRLGSCYMVPGIDYPRYAFSGAQMPKQGDFDSICKLCSRKGAGITNGDSDVTQTSSSSEEGQ